MNSLALHFLGSPAFTRDGAPISLTRAKSIALLLYLAATRRSQPRERVLDLLWPESLPQAARKNMRNMLWEIGDVLGDGVLIQDGLTLSLAPAVNIDIHAFEDGLLLLQSSGAAALEAATAHYRGTLADGLTVHEAPEFELWLATERERLATLYLRLLDRIIALHQAAGNWDAVVSQAQRALAADPLREATHLALIEANMQLGQRPQAMQQYAALVATLRKELDVEPLPETTTRYEALLAGARAPQAPSPQRPAPTPTPTHEAFVGRTAELTTLKEELIRATQGTARIVMISGDMGMGKSRLWQHWAETQAGNVCVLATHALETSEPMPFAPLLALFRQPGSVQALLKPPSALSTIWLAELARLLPEIRASWPQLPPPLAVPQSEERGRLLQALTEALRALATPALVLAIDDLHWADPSTLDWLVVLADQLRQTMPLLIIGTYRPQDAPERLMQIIAGWQRKGQVRSIAVPHLSDDEAYRLLAAYDINPTQEQAAHWVRQSGGNPLFLMELRRAQTNDPPDDLAALVRARVRTTVPAFAQQVLQAAAVLGNQARFATLQETSGRSENETVDALDALTSAAVLKAQTDVYSFVHPLVGTVVRQDLTAARRGLLHRRAAVALEREYAPKPERIAAQLVEHYAAAGALKQAAHYAELASEQAAAIGANIEAAQFARRALAWEPTPQRQLQLGASLAISGTYDEAKRYLERAVGELEREDDVVGLTRALFMLTLISVATSRPQEGRTWLARVPMERVQHIAPEVSAQIYLMMGTVERQSQNYAAAVAYMERAAQLARQQQMFSMEAEIAFERGNLLADDGERSGALAAFEEAVRLGQVHPNPTVLAMANNNLAYHTLQTGDTVRAREHLQAAVAITEQHALSFHWQYVHSTQGEIALAEGALDEADAAFARAFEAAQTWGNRVHMANVRINQAYVAHARHQPEQARALLDEAQELLDGSVDPFVRRKIALAEEELSGAG